MTKDPARNQNGRQQGARGEGREDWRDRDERDERAHNEEAAGRQGLEEPVSPITASLLLLWPRDSPVPVASPRERRATGLMHLRLHCTPFISYGRFAHARARLPPALPLLLFPSCLSFISLSLFSFL